MEESLINQTQEERILETPGTDDTTQLELGGEGKGEEDAMEKDGVEDEEKELLEDDLRLL